MEKTPRRPAGDRRAVAYVLAMLYLLLFTALAIGFCAASTMSVQIARNDRAAADAQAAAESGLQVVRYQLSQITFPADTSDANLNQVIAESLNRQGEALAVVGTVIYLPGENDWSNVDPALGTKYRAQVATSGPTIWVKIIGRGESESISRAIQLQFRKSSKQDGTIRVLPDAATYEEVSP